VACRACHPAGSPARPAHANCTDCHQDRHAGQLADRAHRGRCEACHSVEGFLPARFTLDDHARTSFALEGAHRAVPCDACHKAAPVERLRAARVAVAPAARGMTEQLRFPSTTCTACHEDPHGGTATGGGGCGGCHTPTGWSAVSMDHARATGFALLGRHARISCRSCHRPAGGTAPRFGAAPRACTGCHEDAHRGQLARDGRTDCAWCHEPEAWDRVRFDHDATRFRLEGAHARAACARCHRDAAGALRFRGLPVACAGCHGAGS
jgi:hypothetical protein